MVNNRRSEIEIIGQILNLSRSGVKKTEILYQCNLSYTQLCKYLDFLLYKEVLVEEALENNGNSNKQYKLTDKGNLFLKDINRVLVHLV